MKQSLTGAKIHPIKTHQNLYRNLEEGAINVTVVRFYGFRSEVFIEMSIYKVLFANAKVCILKFYIILCGWSPANLAL